MSEKTIANAALIQQSANKPAKAEPTLVTMIKARQADIAKALPANITPDRFTRVVLNAVNTTKELMSCDPMSFLGAMMSSAQLGLEPNTPLGQAYLIPYKGKATFQLGYKGLLDLAHRAGTHVTAQTVYENDEFEYELGLHPDIKHKPAKGDRGNPIAYYATWSNGQSFGFEVMSIEDVKKHRDRFSQAKNSGPWASNFDEMAKKTVLKKALKYAPLSIEAQAAVAMDETIKTKVDVGHMDTVPDEFPWDENVIDVKVNADTGEVAS